MCASSMADAAHRARGPASHIEHWVFESVAGRISGCDGEGRVLIAIATSPRFGPRLAAAFDSLAALAALPSPARAVRESARPAFPF